jgi:molecular chaperone DnaK
VGTLIGIDLGTSNSCVAVMESGVPQVIPNQEGERTTPSVVGFTAEGQVLVGEIAKQHALTNPKNAVSAVTRLIGRRFNSPELISEFRGQTEIRLPFISADASGPKHLNTVLSRQRYEELTDDLLDRTIGLCKRCLSDAGLKPEQINEVLLVGGQTRTPKIAEVVRKVFGKEPNRTLNPDEAVAMGAAIQAGSIEGKVKDIVLLDVTPHTLGIETEGGTFTPIIDRNSTIPTRSSRVFSTLADNQTRFEVHVLQGESDMAANNWSLARFELTNIPPSPRGVPTIEVTFEIDVNGIYTVSAQHQATDPAHAMVIHPSGGLSQDEVNRLVFETHARESEEKARKELERRVRHLDGLIANTMRSVQALKGKLTPDEQQRILDAIEKAKKARNEGGLEELKQRLQDMEKAATIIGQAMLRP